MITTLTPACSQFDNRVNLDVQDSNDSLDSPPSSARSKSRSKPKPKGDITPELKGFRIRAAKKRVSMSIVHPDLEACSCMFVVLNRWSGLSPRLRLLLEAAANSACGIVPISNDPSSVHLHGWLSSIPFALAPPPIEAMAESSLSETVPTELAQSALWTSLPGLVVISQGNPESSYGVDIPIPLSRTTSTTSSFNQVMARRQNRRMSEPGIELLHDIPIASSSKFRLSGLFSSII